MFPPRSRRSSHPERVRRGRASPVVGIALIVAHATAQGVRLCAQQGDLLRRHDLAHLLRHRSHAADDLDALPAEVQDLGDRETDELISGRCTCRNCPAPSFTLPVSSCCRASARSDRWLRSSASTAVVGSLIAGESAMEAMSTTIRNASSGSSFTVRSGPAATDCRSWRSVKAPLTSRSDEDTWSIMSMKRPIQNALLHTATHETAWGTESSMRPSTARVQVKANTMNVSMDEPRAASRACAPPRPTDAFRPRARSSL
jgi:hypothetical protein